MKTPAFSVYNASAGSGKTYTLVKEYLKIILKSNQNDTYRSILAITFTNKAVFEMKSRIIDSLFDFSKDNPTQKSIDLMMDLEKEIFLNKNQIKIKSQAIIKNIIHNYAGFDISTIDKFTHKVIRSFALDLGLSINFEVSLDTDNLLQEAVDGIVDQAGEDPILTKLLVDYTMEKADDDKSWDVSKEIVTTGKLILNENNRSELDALKDKTIPDFIDFRMQLEQLCANFEKESIQLANQALQLIEDNGIDYKSFYGNYIPKCFIKIADGNLFKNTKNYNYLEEGKGYSKTTNPKDKDAIDSIANILLENLTKINEIAEKYLLYTAYLKNITPLSLLNTVSNQLMKIQEEQNVLSISEFNKLIFEHIHNQPAPFIYERLGEKYKHFFIDEFQDTSQMQWQNLIPLIDNALASETLQGVQGTLMIVGDPKQSIYRWRGGKAEQFINLSKENTPFSNNDVKAYNLETNYRSFDEIITFNNQFFSFLASKFQNLDYLDLYQNQSYQKANSKKGGYVNLTFLPEIEKSETFETESDDENLDATKNDLYLLKTIQTIHEIRAKGFKDRDIVILTRNNKSGVLLANYLTEQNINIISAESLLINASSEVKFLLHLFEYIANKKDKEALANALYYLSQNTENVLDTHDFIAKGINFETEEELESWLETYQIKISFQNCRKKSLYELTEYLVSVCLSPNKNNAYVQYFLDIILEKDIRNQFNILSFLEFWEKKGNKLSIPSDESANAIRIMTIHKAKGLEFSVVIFPFAEENYSANKSEKMWLNNDQDSLNFDTFLINKSIAVQEYGEVVKEVYDQKKQEDLLDNINVLYVALTRAEEQLYIISSVKKRNSSGDLPNNAASFFIEFLEQFKSYDKNTLTYEMGDATRISKPETEKPDAKKIVAIKNRIHPSAIKIAQREALMWGTKQQKAIEYGNILHEILSFINTETDIDFALQKAMEEGLITTSQKEEVHKTLNDIVHHRELVDFFNPNSQVLNEWNIIKKENKTIKPDRIVIQGENAFLLDYKTGLHQSKYEKQLKEYENALQEIGFQVKKKVLLYIGENLEIVHL